MIAQYKEHILAGNKYQFLDWLNNSMPFDSKTGNLEVQSRTEKYTTKWQNWWEIREYPYKIKPINNRLIAIPELLCDYDPNPNETKKDFVRRINENLKLMREDHVKILGVFHSGSRGVHVHALVSWLCYLPKREREGMKTFLLKRYGAEIGKANRSMITCELSKNTKTGKYKRWLK